MQAPADRRGQFIGVYRMLPELGSTGGPIVLGLVLDSASLWAGTVAGAVLGTYIIVTKPQIIIKKTLTFKKRAIMHGFFVLVVFELGV